MLIKPIVDVIICLIPRTLMDDIVCMVIGDSFGIYISFYLPGREVECMENC